MSSCHIYYTAQLVRIFAWNKKRTKHLRASKWINQVLVIKKTSNENVLLEEKCKNVSNKKISLVKVVDFWCPAKLQKSTIFTKEFFLFETFLHFSSSKTFLFEVFLITKTWFVHLDAPKCFVLFFFLAILPASCELPRTFQSQN